MDANPKQEQEASPAQPPAAGERFQATDAFWLIHSIDYVPSGPSPTGPLFDSPDRLHRAWELTSKSLCKDAIVGDARTAHIKAAERIAKEVRQEALAELRKRTGAAPHEDSSQTEARNDVATVSRVKRAIGRLVNALFASKAERGAV
jgi:hypothetical protein